MEKIKIYDNFNDSRLFKIHLNVHGNDVVGRTENKLLEDRLVVS